ncbi:MAG: polymerase subunit gamma/tau, partial [Burkholderiaceae bacterium]|nr:polymerase subunit gamma/tau [Burkholderiaceae bacterium]
MESLYDTVAQRMSTAWRSHDVSKHSRSFRCQCGRHVFFRNSLCIACSTPLGYLPDRSAVVPLTPGSAPGRWRAADAQHEYKRCANLDTPAGCNWLLPADEAASHCISCRLDRTIPDLGDADNRLYWSAIE